MRSRATLVLLLSGFLPACSAPQGPAPSLAPRPAEAIDPRVPLVTNPVRSGPVDAQLATHLAALLDQVQSGDAAFKEAADFAARLAASAGAPKSESWIAAQQALSAALSARGPTTRALGDIDGLASNALATKGGIAPADLAAIRAAADRASQIDRWQAERIREIEGRLGL